MIFTILINIQSTIHYHIAYPNSSSFAGGSEPNSTNPSTSKEDKTKETLVQNPKQSRPTIVLRSHKMKELKDLLTAEKLNTHAISLHLTAQSQVQIGKKGRSESENDTQPKRTRRK